jgi:hypothetical protein
MKKAQGKLAHLKKITSSICTLKEKYAGLIQLAFKKNAQGQLSHLSPQSILLFHILERKVHKANWHIYKKAQNQLPQFRQCTRLAIFRK